MDIVISILVALAFGAALNLIIKTTFGGLFLALGKPLTWGVVVSLLVGGATLLAAAIGAAHSSLFWGFVLAIFASMRSAGGREVAEGLFAEVGIRRGNMKYRAGLALSSVAFMAAYAVSFGEYVQR